MFFVFCCGRKSRVTRWKFHVVNQSGDGWLHDNRLIINMCILYIYMQVAFAAQDLPVRVLERRAVYMRVIDGVSYTAVLLHAGHDRFRAMRIYRGNVSVCVCVCIPFVLAATATTKTTIFRVSSNSCDIGQICSCHSIGSVACYFSPRAFDCHQHGNVMSHLHGTRAQRCRWFVPVFCPFCCGARAFDKSDNAKWGIISLKSKQKKNEIK